MRAELGAGAWAAACAGACLGRLAEGDFESLELADSHCLGHLLCSWAACLKLRQMSQQWARAQPRHLSKFQLRQMGSPLEVTVWRLRPEPFPPPLPLGGEKLRRDLKGLRLRRLSGERRLTGE